MKRFLAVWAAAAAAALAGCDNPPIQPWTPSEGLDKVGLQVYWQTNAKDLGLAGGERLMHLWRIQEHVYCVTNTNRLIALDATTGVARWAVQVAPLGQRVFRPTHVSGVSLTDRIPGAVELVEQKATPMAPFDAVLINSSSEVLVIDRQKGRVVRRIDLEHGASCGGASDGVIFCVGAADGRYYGIALQQAVKAWVGYIGSGVDAPVEYFGGTFYLGGLNGVMLTTRASRQWTEPRKRTLGGPITAPFFVDGRGCFIPDRDSFLYSFNSDVSQKLWDHPFATHGTLQRPVQVGDKTVFQRAEGDKFYAINLVDGQERWNLPRGVQVLATIGPDVYVRDTAGKVLQVDEILGATKGTASLGAMDLFVGNVTEPVIYVGWQGGLIQCLRPLSAGKITVEMLKKMQP